ncbi:MAG: ABC transporter permease [Deltaproteobacteria bacterium]|nr:MAG: ABC transporter permease [Deltaproteobacteria bacterium]
MSQGSELGKIEKEVEEALGGFFENIGQSAMGFLESLGGMALMSLRTISSLFKYHFPLQPFLSACEFVGVRSLNLISVVALFTGMVLALQFAVGLERFGLKIDVGQVVGISIIRELGPVLTSLMVAARVGSGIASELGSMVVTEQVLAIEALGANPVHKLVLPRVLATTWMTPVLVVAADIIGVLGGMWIAYIEAGVTPRYYLEQIQRTVSVDDFFSGLSKSIFFGFFIGIISCYQGLQTKGGTVGVGESTTHAVVYSSLIVFISDFFLTKLFILF